MTVDEFDEQLLKCEPENFSDFIDRYILGGIPAVFSGDQSAYDSFRNRVADKFRVQPENIVIVGSGGLGFSYFKKTRFSSESDVDVAIVSEDLFDKYSRIICRYNHDVIRYRIALAGEDWKRYLMFLKYFAAGWIRPDKGTEIMYKNTDAANWWQYFRSISYGKSEVGDHKVNAGIYKSSFYLKEYIRIGLADYRQSIIQQGVQK
jgi:hypothetical protein